MKLAVAMIGILVGADLALWFYDISYHLVTVVASWPEETAVLVGLLIVLIGALIGFWFVRQYRDEALVLASVALGTEIVYLTLGLSENSSFTAVLVLSVALAGVVVQYADYLRELKRAEKLGIANSLMP
ncbi:MAG: hypothetical protein HC804_02670 [Anaerolineae bacterium]|nr:hypothetical protein [Anaerolineae bacterium]